jgi:hypothetical protein
MSRGSHVYNSQIFPGMKRFDVLLTDPVWPNCPPNARVEQAYRQSDMFTGPHAKATQEAML